VQPSKKFTVRLAIYSAGLLYLAADLFLFDGPLRDRIEASRPDSEEALTAARKQGVVARVMGRPIRLSQVERATHERLWLRGRRLEDLRPEQRRTERLAALNELIDHEILRTKVLHNMDRFPVEEARIDAAVRQFAGRFRSREAMRQALATEGIDSEKELRYRLAARLQQEAYVESQIAEHLVPSEDEARAWFETHRSRFAQPRRIRARHVFLPTLDHPSAEARQRLAEALEELRQGRRDFAELVATISEDPRSKSCGGDLGWMTRARLPDDFGDAAFALPLGEPRLIQTSIGWHLIEVTDTRPAEPANYEQVRDEVFTALESARRIELVRNLRSALRATEGVGVHVFPEMISGR
jgi:parvulin-like peptidyl-prolyl isomerase